MKHDVLKFTAEIVTPIAAAIGLVIFVCATAKADEAGPVAKTVNDVRNYRIGLGDFS